MSAEEIRRGTQDVWDRFYSFRSIWARASVVKSLKARLIFVLISKLYRQMYANTGIATDSARVNRSAKWARWMARVCRPFFAGRPIPGGGGRKDLAWLRADGTEMTEREWHSPDVRTLGMYLDGDGIRQRGPRGERLTDDTYLLVLHAGAEDTTFALPGLPWASGWEVVVDTAYSDGRPPAGSDRPASDLPVTGRSALLLRAVRTPVVGAPLLSPEPPGPGTV